MPWTLCTKEQVTSIRPYPLANLEDWWSDTVENLIKDYMGTKNLGEVVTVSAELHSGEGLPVIILKHPPIISVSAVRVSDAILTATDYQVFQNYIMLKNSVFPEGTLNISIDYISGGDTDPTVTLTAVAMICALINYKERYGADSSVKWSVTDAEYGEKTPNMNVGLTSHLTQIMKRMLRRERVRFH